MAYMGFDKLKASIAAKGGVTNPGAVAAAIGRRKYGAPSFQRHAAAGTSMRRAAVLQHMHGSGEADRHSYPRTGSDNRALEIHGTTGHPSEGAKVDLNVGTVHGARGVPASGARAQFQYVGAQGSGTATPGRPPQATQYVGVRGRGGAPSGPQAYAPSGRGPNNGQPIHGTRGRFPNNTPNGLAGQYGTAVRGNTHPRRPVTASRTHYVDPNAYRTNFLGTYR